MSRLKRSLEADGFDTAIYGEGEQVWGAEHPTPDTSGAPNVLVPEKGETPEEHIASLRKAAAEVIEFTSELAS